MQLTKIEFLQVPVIPEKRGNLSFLQNSEHIPFEIKRVYWVNNVHGVEKGTGHANKLANEMIIALSGSFDVLVHDGIEETSYTLSRPDVCLIIPSMNWRKFDNFSTNSVAFIATDRQYDYSEKITDLRDFQMSTLHA